MVKRILLKIGATPYARFWRNDTGLAISLHSGEKFKYGTPGAPDILGIIQGGIFIGFECKTGGAVQNSEQKNFEAMIHRFGGFYFVVKNEHDAQMNFVCVLKQLGVLND